MNHSLYVEKTSWDGEEAILLSAGGFEGIIMPSVGANFISLVHKERKLDILRTPSDIYELKKQPEVWGIPFLLLPNRIGDGTFTIGDRVYSFPINTEGNNHIHGFVHKRRWKVAKMQTFHEDMAEVELKFENCKSSDFFVHYPHEFICRITFRLSRQGLTKTVYVENRSSVVMPMGAGYHTAIKIPFREGGRIEDYRVWLAVGKKWELDERNLPTGKQLELNENEKQLRIGGIMAQGEAVFGHYAVEPLELGDRKFNGCIIEDSCSETRLFYEAGSNFGHWMIWNQDGKSGFFCPEPMSWVANAPNIMLPHAVTGLVLLESAGTWKETCRITIKGDEKQ